MNSNTQADFAFSAATLATLTDEDCAALGIYPGSVPERISAEEDDAAMARTMPMYLAYHASRHADQVLARARTVVESVCVVTDDMIVA